MLNIKKLFSFNLIFSVASMAIGTFAFAQGEGKEKTDAGKQSVAKSSANRRRDPRVSMVTITDVEVSNDTSHAKVFFTTLGNEAQIASCGHGLSSAAGFLRKQLASRLTIRVAPSLTFEFDSSIDRGVRLSKLIDDALADDSKHSH